MTNTKALQRFLSDEQILEVLVKFQDRKIDACRLLQAYLDEKWQLTTIQAMGILQRIHLEWATPALMQTTIRYK